MADLREIARTMCEDAFGAGELELFDRYRAPHHVLHDPLLGEVSVKDEKESVRKLRIALPDFKVSAKRIIVEGDLVVVQWTATGTHRGEMMGAPASGRSVSMHGIDLSRFEGDKVAETWSEIDSLGMMQQLGLIPKLTPPPPSKEAGPS